MRVIFAPNLCEDWETLRRLLHYAARERIGLLVTTRIVAHPIGEAHRAQMDHCVKVLRAEPAARPRRQRANIDELAARFSPSESHTAALCARRYLELRAASLYEISAKYASLVAILDEHPEVNLAAVAGDFDIVPACDDDKVKARLDALLIGLKATLLANGQSHLPLVGIGGACRTRDDVPPTFQRSDFERCCERGLARLLDPPPPFVVVHDFPRRPQNAKEKRFAALLNRLGPGTLVATSTPFVKADEAFAHLFGGALLLKGSFLARSSDAEESDFHPATFWELTWQSGVLARAMLRQFPPAESPGYVRQNFQVVPHPDGRIELTQFEEPHQVVVDNTDTDNATLAIRSSLSEPRGSGETSSSDEPLRGTAAPKAVAEKAARTIARGRRGRRRAKGRPLDVLLVEATPLLGLIYRRLLERRGCRVRDACSESEALDKVRAELPDVIVLDTATHNAKAIDLIRRFRHDIGVDGVPVVALYPQGRHVPPESGLGRVADLCLPRDFDVAKLLSTVRDLVTVPAARRVADRNP